MDKSIEQHLKGVIMAGGSGTRFWPKSRRLFPKQFLKILGDKSMLQMTIERLLPLISMENIYIVGNKILKSLFNQQVPECVDSHLILEPVGKNTAACITTIAFILSSCDPESILVILPADHWVSDPGIFIETLKRAAYVAFHEKAIVTIGILPTFPSTGYGYIKVPKSQKKRGGNDFTVHKVETFVEKPDLEHARSYFASGNFFWNSGIFVTRVDIILNEIATYLPDLHSPLKKLQTIAPEAIQNFLDEVYTSLLSISIDYGVMEKTDKAMMIEADFGWSDVGTWDALYSLSPKDPDGNVTEGMVLLEGCRDCMVNSYGRLIAGVGLDNMIVVDTPDAILILPRGRSQDVRRIVDRLKEKGIEELL